MAAPSAKVRRTVGAGSIWGDVISWSADDWVARIADQVLAEHERRGAAGPVVCASGISPSGPIHLGNLREIMVPHAVADEVRRRGVPCRHLLSWDDYDRLRKVPVDVPPSFAEHIGRPLTAVPDPCGEHASWAEHFKAPFRESLAALRVEVDEISQTEMYGAHAYRDRVLEAMRVRHRIDEVLARYRTLRTEDESDGTGDAYYPYRPYCRSCGRDSTTVTGYDDGTTVLAYDCACGHRDELALAEVSHGKLVWKVDWPMRWAYEGVTFEAGGVDHSSPGSSQTVGAQIVELFGGTAPVYVAYSFVGTSGSAKMSSSSGAVVRPADALGIMEPQLLRWLYLRRKPNQSITVSFDQEVGRLYDEWDALTRRAAEGERVTPEVAARVRAQSTASGPLPETPRPLPFRTLASLVDVTTGDEEQLRRILADLDPAAGAASLDDYRPRLDRARTWVLAYVASADRTHVRTEPDTELLASLTPAQAADVARLADSLDDSWSLDGLTRIVYGIPKAAHGLGLDDPPTPEAKVSQREYFALLYRLLVGRDTGPRLPTLLLAVGRDRIRTLLRG